MVIPGSSGGASVLANAAVFTASAGLIWLAGTRLTSYADQIATRTGISRAFLGAILLGGVTSLPELSTTVTAAAMGNAPLAVNNIIGGVGMQVAVLAIADSATRRPLSAVHGPPVILLHGCLVILMASLVAAGILLGEPAGVPVGPWAAAVTLVAIIGLYLLHRRGGGGGEPGPSGPEGGGRTLGMKTLIAAAAVLVGGTVAARTADALAEQTGLGAGLMGFFFLALATSLPEISTTVSAARMGLSGMAFSNIFASNILDLSLLGVADVAYAGAPVLSGLGAFSILGCLLCTILTAIYLAGLIERRDRAIRRWGPDSLLVVVVYLAGSVALFSAS